MNRAVGRPHGKGLVFTRAAIAKIPDVSSLVDLSQALDVSFSTVRNWVVSKGAPATETGGRWQIDKIAFIEWLKNTDRIEGE